MKQDFNEVFKIRKIKKNDEEVYMITIGDKLASWEEFETEKKAQMKINKTDWNLVASMFAILTEAERRKDQEIKNDAKTFVNEIIKDTQKKGE
nr:MAG TPA: hypothetical protein [Microviridae sp.]